MANLKLSMKIARVHLVSKPKQTIVAMLGVTFGIAMFIALIGLMNGLNNFTEETTMTATPDIHIFQEATAERATIIDELYPNGLNIVHHQKPKDEPTRIRNAWQITALIREDPRVRGVSPLVATQVFYNYGPVQLNGNVLGVNILDEDRLFGLRPKMKQGRLEDLLTNPNSIIMGKGLARKLNVRMGDRVVITTPAGTTMMLKIVGIFQMGIGMVDNVRSYANIETVQAILQRDHSFVTDINLKLNDRNLAPIVAREFQTEFVYRAEDWETANSTFLTGMIIRNIMTYSVSITLLIVAGFGIFNIMNMTIYNKMKDIAILKAMGFQAADVKNIFLIQSMVIGFIGGIAGLVIGYGLSVLISKAPFNGGEMVSLEHLPVSFDALYYFIGIGFGLTTTFVAGYMPSRKAGKVDPIEILRGQ